MKTIDCLYLAHKSIKGLSIGDAFGDSFFGEQDKILNFIKERKIPLTKWEFTDDTVMALAILDELELGGAITKLTLFLSYRNH